MKIGVFFNLPGGGSVRVIKKITEYIKSKNNIVDVYTICESSVSNWVDKIWETEIIKMNVNPWKGFLPRILWLLLILPQIHKKLAKQLILNKYDCLIVTHDYFTKSPYLLKYYSGKKIYILHEPQREFYESGKFHAPYIKDKIANIFRYPLKYVDLQNAVESDVIIANSKYSQKVIRNVYGKTSYVVYPGVDTNLYKSVDKKENILLYIGGISRVKGYDFLIKAIKPILGKYKLIMIGDGRDKEKRNAVAVADDKSDSIKIIDHVSDKNIVKYLQKAKVLCIASYREPFGLTSIEAQACGTPVVCLKEGGVPETIIPGKTGFLSRRNLKEYQNKVLIAINRQEEMSKDCRDWVQNNWTWDKSLERLYKLIQK